MTRTHSTNGHTPTHRVPALPAATTPPHNLDAEKAVLGSILRDNATYPAILRHLPSPDQFYADAHRKIYRAIQELHLRRQPVDLVTLGEQLHADRVVEDLGGYGYLTQIFDGTPVTVHAVYYARIVREKAILRELYHLSGNLLLKSQQPDGSVAALLQQARDSLAVVPEPTLSQDGAAQGGPVKLADVQELPVHWLWEPYIPRGMLTLIDGDPGLGKSFVTMDLAARLSRGWPMPFQDGNARPCNVLLVNSEDDVARVQRKRLLACGADEEHVYVLPDVPGSEGPRGFLIPDDVPYLRQEVDRLQAGLVVIDMVLNHLQYGINPNKDNEVRRALLPLKRMAEEAQVAVILVRHLNKQTLSSETLYRGGGSIAWIGMARSALLCGRDSDDPTLRILALNKSNVADTNQQSVSFRIEPGERGPRVEWVGMSDRTKDDILCRSETSKPGPVGDKMEAAKAFLKGMLSMGERSFEDIKEAGTSFNEALLRRAKRALGIRHQRRQFQGGVWWRLPVPDDLPEPEGGENGEDGEGSCDF